MTDGGPLPQASLDAAPADAGLDAPELDAGIFGLVCSGTLPVMKTRNLVTNEAEDADWSCYDAADAGALQAAAPQTVQFHLSPGPLPDTPDLQQRVATLVAGVSVDFFFGPSTLGTPALTRTFDGYSVTVEVPAGATSLSARINPHENDADGAGLSVVELHDYGIPLPLSGESAEGHFVMRASRALAADLVLDGGMPDPEKAVLVTVARDCRGRDVSGAQIALIDAETNQPVASDGEPGAPRAAYTQFALPSPACTFSNAEQPAWMLVDAPVNIRGETNTHAYRLRIQGRMRASDPAPVVFAEGEVELFSGVVTYLSSLPRVYRR
jgi:hypothetical protein